MSEQVGHFPDKKSNEDVHSEKLTPQQKLLIVAKEHGVFDLLDERRRNLLDVYYNTPTPQTQLKAIAGGVNQPQIHKLIISGLTRLRDALPQDVQEPFPDDALKKRKPLPAESRARIGAASRGRTYIVTDQRREASRKAQLGKTKSSEVRANMSAGHKRYWRERREREKQETVVFDNSSNQL